MQLSATYQYHSRRPRRIERHGRTTQHFADLSCTRSVYNEAFLPPCNPTVNVVLAAQRPGGTPIQGQPPPHQQLPHQGYAGGYPAPAPSAAAPTYQLPPPSNSGSLDLSHIKPVNSGSVSFNDAVAKARGIAAERGVSYDTGRSNGSKNVFWECERVQLVPSIMLQ